ALRNRRRARALSHCRAIRPVELLLLPRQLSSLAHQFRKGTTMAGITTHVLNTTTGQPGSGMRIDFSVLENNEWRLVKSVRTNADARTAKMILKPEARKVADTEFLFQFDASFRAQG